MWDERPTHQHGGQRGDMQAARHLQSMRRDGKRPSTVYQRERVIARLQKHTGKDWTESTAVDLETFLDRPMSNESRATEVSHLRALFGWAVDYEVVGSDPTRRLKRPRLPRRLPQPIGEADLAWAIDTAPMRVRPMLLFACYAGLRAMEIAALRADDLWWNADPPVIVVSDGKGGAPGVVPLSPVLEAELRVCDLPRRGWLFPRHDGQPGPVPAHLVSHLCNDHLHSLGINSTLHKLRHRFGTQVLRHSGNLRHAQEALRHRSITSTQIYTAVTNVELAAAVNAVPSVRLGR